jgi:hypothetical protein
MARKLLGRVTAAKEIAMTITEWRHRCSPSPSSLLRDASAESRLAARAASLSAPAFKMRPKKEFGLHRFRKSPGGISC